MKQIVPDYYEKFRCIAHECKHNCCIGWEIDIDEDTFDYYNTVEGAMGERFRMCISDDGDSPHFCLSENERCPFLNEKNLCEIITTLGEDALCDICADHPRFRNFFSDREEIGLGLCCESAGQLILSNEDNVRLISIFDDGESESLTEEEKEILKLREEFFSVIESEDKSLNEKISLILSLGEAERKERSLSEWADIFLSMERLDEKWTEVLLKLKNADEKELKLLSEEVWDKFFSKLLHYFIYRQFSLSAEDGRVKERLLFAVDSCLFIRTLCMYHCAECDKLTLSDVVEYSRMYSSEMEYSEENVENYLSFC